MYGPDTHFLIVDDMSTLRIMVRNALKSAGYEHFTEAENGDAAWEALNSADPPIDFVISDWNMPEKSGVDFLKMVRAEPKYETLPFVLLTSEAERDQVMEAIQAKVSSYMVKPFTPDVLIEKLAQVYQKYNP